MADDYYEPLFTWKKFLSWKTVIGFLVAIGGFSLGYYTQTFFHNRSQPEFDSVTATGQPPSDSNEDPYIIDFSHQGLIRFPEFLLNRGEITNLILSYNTIGNLPPEIAGLERLRVLDMRYNSLSGPLTEAVTALPLVDLNLSHNRLSSIPNGLDQMDELRYFDISHNQLTSIPDSITQLQDLKWLNLAGNPLDETEINEMREQMPSTIINF